MGLPFTREQFFDVFAAYNQAMGPVLPVAAWLLGLAALALPWLRSTWADRMLAAVLAVCWLVVGLGYHLGFFAAVNPLAPAFAGLFVAGAGVFLVEGVWRGRIAFQPCGGLRGALAGLAVSYALLAYPLIGLAMHGYPRVPLFGVTPCPTAIFTLGLLLLSRSDHPWLLAGAPLLWSVLGGSAAVLLGVVQDWGLPLAGLAWLLVRPLEPVSSARSSASPTAPSGSDVHRPGK